MKTAEDLLKALEEAEVLLRDAMDLAEEIFGKNDGRAHEIGEAWSSTDLAITALKQGVPR